MQRILSAKPNRRVGFTAIFGGVIFIFLLLLIFSSLLPAQVKPVNDLLNWTKEINIAVGSAITNDNTERALNAVDKIRGLKKTIHLYNERFGNDSVHAIRFVDREPDPKADDNIVKNYYNVVVVSDSVHHVSQWFTFLVRKDFNEVLYYDMKKSKTAGIEDWKKVWPASEFLKPMTGNK